MTYNRGKGKCIDFLRGLIGHTGTECVKWPYTRDQQGRGVLGYNGEPHQAARLMCEMVNGPAPSDVHQAAHTCGKGHEGCVNPNHMAWKTPPENGQDMATHGTAKKPGGPRTILTPAQVVEIRSFKGIKTLRELAKEYGVAWETIGDVMRGRTHTGVPQRYKTRTPPAQREALMDKAVELRMAGKNHYQIAEEIGMSRCTVRAYLKIRNAA